MSSISDDRCCHLKWCKKSCQKDFPSRKVSIIFLLTMVVASVIVITAVLLGNQHSNGKITECSGQCLNNAYRHLSLPEYVNSSIDPCENFYDFACSNWINQRSLPEAVGMISPYTILQREVSAKIKDILENTPSSSSLPRGSRLALDAYKICINSAAQSDASIEHLQDVYRDIGGWPLLQDDEWDEQNYNWIDAVATLLKKMGFHSVIGVLISADDKSTNRNIIFLDQPQIPTQSISNHFVKQMVLSVAEILGNKNKQKILSDLKEVEELEHAIKLYSRPEGERLNISHLYQKLTIDELQEEIPHIDWLYLIQRIMNETLVQQNDTIISSEEIVVLGHNYLLSILEMIKNGTFTKRTIANYIGWIVAEEFHAFIPNVFKAYQKNIHSEMSEKEINSIVERKCQEKITRYFDIAVDYIYAMTRSDVNQTQAKEMVAYIRNAFAHLVDTADWIDSQTKDAILVKLKSMLEIIGYPTVMLNMTAMDSIFKTMPDITSDTLTNFIRFRQFIVNQSLASLREENTKDIYITPKPLTEISAYYLLRNNAFVFPTSIQYPPYYYTDGPWYLNFGAIGSIIGHEVTHGFDDQGHKRDKDGNLIDWWGNITREEYFRRAQCFVDQYDSYKLSEINQKVNGRKTLGENIADSGGVRQAFYAYKSWIKDYGVENKYPGLENFTPEQMFFISYASIWCTKITPGGMAYLLYKDVHSPAKFRVIGTLSNFEEFSEAFGCAKGSPMNPAQKCVIW